MQPSEFWELSPTEFWWEFDAKLKEAKRVNEKLEDFKTKSKSGFSEKEWADARRRYSEMKRDKLSN